ncbi:hypothetical protein D9M70_571010 [compost metagenome]
MCGRDELGEVFPIFIGMLAQCRMDCAFLGFQASLKTCDLLLDAGDLALGGINLTIEIVEGAASGCVFAAALDLGPARLADFVV